MGPRKVSVDSVVEVLGRVGPYTNSTTRLRRANTYATVSVQSVPVIA